MRRFFLISLLPFWLFYNNAIGQYSQSDIANHALGGKIIRSFAVNPENDGQLLVGTKGKAGEGKVFISYDYGMKWEALNEGAPLCDSCEDVQTVCFADDQTLLAGTWKNGLFISTNGGKKFNKVKKFPAEDVRSVVAAFQGTLYAATTTQGILKSDDAGKNWERAHTEKLNEQLASWKIALQPGTYHIIYALTLKNGLQKSMDNGVTWKQVVYEEGLIIWDIGFVNNEIYAVGSTTRENFLFHSYIGDKKWKKFKLNMDGKINSIEIAKTFIDYELMLGTWDNGIQTTFAIEYSNEGYRCVSLIKQDTVGVADIYSTKNYIYNFSWGDGIKMIRRELDCEIVIPGIATNDCKQEPCFTIYSNCGIDYWNFKLYNRWGEFFMKDSTGIESTNTFMNDMRNFKESGQYIYWLKTSFEDNIDTINMKGFITIQI